MLTFEWILLVTLLVIGVVGGVSSVRDGLVSELGDVGGAIVHIDQSYTVEADACSGTGNEFGFADTLPTCIGEGIRPATPVVTQGPVAPACD